MQSSSQQVVLPTQKRVKRRFNIEKLTTIAIFLLPAAILYAIFVIGPVAQAVYYSFYKWNGLGPLTDFVGIDNFIRILGDKAFNRAVTHNVVIIILSILIQLPFALALALMVNRGLRGKTIFRTIFFLPYVLSDVVTGVVFNFIYKPDNGLLNSLLAVLPGFVPIGWLGNPQTVLWAVFAVITWKFFGLHLILFLAALQNVPVELEEAAAMDGATRWQTLIHITLPLLGSTARLSIYLSVLGSIQIFDLVWVMTTGGPVGASDTMATYMYKFGIQRFAIGYGSSVAVVMFLLCFAFSVFYQRMAARLDHE